MNIQRLLESSNPYQKQRSQVSRFERKWERTGLLEGLNEIEKGNMALMLENQAKRLIVESNTTGIGTSGFTGGANEAWAGVALPLVRRIFSQMSSKEFLSVQPMNLPSGLIFYLDFKYENGKSIYGSPADEHPNVTEDLKGGLYGAGKFGYTLNQKEGTATAVAVAAVTEKDVNFDSRYTVADLKKVTLTLDPTVTAKIDKDGVRAIKYKDSHVAEQYNQFTSLSGNDLVFIVKTDGTDPSELKFDYPQVTDYKSRGDFEDNTQNSPLHIPTLDIKLKSEAITAKTRKMKAQWTPEFAQDLQAYHSIDAESELTGLLSNYISVEIDLENIDMLMNGATFEEYWSALNNTQVTEAGVDAGSLGYYNDQAGWFRTLGTKITKLSNKIHQATMRGGANFIIVSPTVATIFESMSGFLSDAGSKDTFGFGIMKVGTFQSKYKVYKNPYMTENTMLLGYKGKQFLETGAVYAPYIPLMMTPMVYDPETFTPKKGIMTRYAKKLVRPEYYGKIHIHGLETI